ncbi:MAG: hypothetical protein D6808_00095, partial [Candidatus Dadabacteria bacterium]
KKTEREIGSARNKLRMLREELSARKASLSQKKKAHEKVKSIIRRLKTKEKAKKDALESERLSELLAAKKASKKKGSSKKKKKAHPSPNISDTPPNGAIGETVLRQVSANLGGEPGDPKNEVSDGVHHAKLLEDSPIPLNGTVHIEDKASVKNKGLSLSDSDLSMADNPLDEKASIESGPLDIKQDKASLAVGNPIDLASRVFSESSQSLLSGGDANNGHNTGSQPLTHTFTANHGGSGADHPHFSRFAQEVTEYLERVESWENLREEGIVLGFRGSEGREVRVELSAHKDGGVRVALVPDSAARQVGMWREKSQIVKALKEAGIEVKEVVIRGRA